MIIAVFGLLTFGSCKKKSSNTCTCKGKGAAMQDTSMSFSTVDSGYTSVSQECSTIDTIFKAFYGSGYGCHM